MEKKRKMAECECSAGLLAIPFKYQALFQQVHAAAYEEYRLAQRTIQFNANEFLGFWCAQCPEGGDCRRPGTTLENIKALSGFFLGLDGSGVSFVECLNTACSEDGRFADGYTGISPCVTVCTIAEDTNSAQLSKVCVFHLANFG